MSSVCFTSPVRHPVFLFGLQRTLGRRRITGAWRGLSRLSPEGGATEARLGKTHGQLRFLRNGKRKQDTLRKVRLQDPAQLHGTQKVASKCPFHSTKKKHQTINLSNFSKNLYLASLHCQLHFQLHIVPIMLLSLPSLPQLSTASLTRPQPEESSPGPVRKTWVAVHRRNDIETTQEPLLRKKHEETPRRNSESNKHRICRMSDNE